MIIIWGLLVILGQYTQPKKKMKHGMPTVKIEGSTYALVQKFHDDGTVLKP
jgi:hypothetical protein